MSYTDTFGGENVNSALLSYIAYDIAADLTLVWPLEAVPDDSVAADKVDVTASVANLSVTVPRGDQASVGVDILFRNPGTNTYFVHDQDGIEIGQVASGEAWYFVLIDNTTVPGVWYAIQFGSGTSSATAASLAGAGLRARFSFLDQFLVTNALLGNYAVMLADLATVLTNGGGGVIYTFDSAITLGNGFFVYVINAGSGNIALTPTGGQTIDGSPTKNLAPTESAVVFSDGANFHTLGYGRSLVNTVTGVTINVAGGPGTISLSASEIAAQVQNWTGALTGDQILDYGGSVGFWFVWNDTTGAFTVTARVNGIDPGVVVPQGAFSIIRSDGTSMNVAFTASSGTVTSVATTAEMTGGPITTAGTLDLSNTGVAAGAYGTTAAKTASFTVSTKGRLTAASEQDIAIVLAQVAPFSSADLRGKLTDETGVGLAVFSDSPTFTGDPKVPTAAAGDNDTTAASTAFVTAAIAAALANVIFNTGDIKYTLNGTLETNWLYVNGDTIGSATSGATHANIIYQALYIFFWNNYSNALCPVSTGRGVSGLADFTANKTLTMLDARGSILAGADNMGGTPRNLLGGAGVGAGFEGAATLGAAWGTQGYGLKAAQQSDMSVAVTVTATGFTSGAVFTGTNVGFTPGISPSGDDGPCNLAVSVSGSGTGTATGSGSATGNNHTNVQPTLICNVLVHI